MVTGTAQQKQDFFNDIDKETVFNLDHSPIPDPPIRSESNPAHQIGASLVSVLSW